MQPDFLPEELDALLAVHEKQTECEHVDICQNELRCLDCGIDLREAFSLPVVDKYVGGLDEPRG